MSREKAARIPRMWLKKHFFSVTQRKSQNHRTGRVGRTTVDHVMQPSCSSRVIPERMAQDFV